MISHDNKENWTREILQKMKNKNKNDDRKLNCGLSGLQLINR